MVREAKRPGNLWATFIMAKILKAPQRGSIIKSFDFNRVGPRGHEQREPRPAVVISSQLYNELNGLCVIAPVTGQLKGYPFEVAVPENSCCIYGAILADQLRTIDWRDRGIVFENDCVSQETIDTVKSIYEAIISAENNDEDG